MKTIIELKELSPQEQIEIDGGWLATALAIIGAYIYCYNNADDFIEGFREGYKQAVE